MEDKKKILRAEITLIVLIVALVVLFQIIGSMDTAAKSLISGYAKDGRNIITACVVE